MKSKGGGGELGNDQTGKMELKISNIRKSANLSSTGYRYAQFTIKRLAVGCEQFIPNVSCIY
jgi:hypothetical protein